jgi:hypothetical protein
MCNQGVTSDLDSLPQMIKLSSVIADTCDAPFVTDILEQSVVLELRN